MSTRTIERRLKKLEQRTQPEKNWPRVCFLMDGMTIEKYNEEHGCEPTHVVRFMTDKDLYED